MWVVDANRHGTRHVCKGHTIGEMFEALYKVTHGDSHP